MTEAAQRLRGARDRTIAARSARICKASFGDGGQDEAPDYESAGVIDFVTGSALLETTARDAQTDRVKDMLTSLPHSDGEASGDAARDWSQASLFVGGRKFSRGGSEQHWVGSEAGWWEPPSLSLDLLSAVSDDVRVGSKISVRGREATEYAGTISAPDLARIDAALARHLLGRRGQQKLMIRAWLDSDDRVVRIWYAIEPSRDNEELWWTAVEFWDFGIETTLEAPPKEILQPPATLRQIARDLWRMRRETRA